MGRKVKIIVDVTKLGALGGKARAANLSGKELTASARAAANARWEQYYREHPEKLKARKEREARKTGKIGRPRKLKGRSDLL
jgi:hypothetical protein